MSVPNDFQLLIKPAGADCNMTCGYCFYRRTESQYETPGPHRMSREVLDALIRRYLKLRLPQTVFCWQGGEPTLMGLDFFRTAVTLMQRHGTGRQPVSNAFQTNGLLLDREWAAFLRQYIFLVGLSMDGPADVHDANRTISGQKGSHAEVLSRMELLRSEEVPFNILAVVSKASEGRAKEIYRYFRDLGVMHMQFIPCIESDPNTRRPYPFSTTPEAYGDFLCELFDAWLPEALDCVSIRIFDGLLRRELTGDSGLCGFETICGHCPVVEHNGDVYPCDFFVQPEWKLGNIVTTPIEKLFARGRLRRFAGAKHRLPDACADCRWAGQCMGGCLKDRQRIAGGFNHPSHFCAAYKRLFEHIERPIKELADNVRARHPEVYAPAPAQD